MEVSDEGLAQNAEDINTRSTTSPLLSCVEINDDVVTPVEIPFTRHSNEGAPPPPVNAEVISEYLLYTLMLQVKQKCSHQE